MMTKVSTGAQIAELVGFQIALTGWQYVKVPMKVIKNDAQVTNKRAYTAIRSFFIVDAMRMIVIQIEDLTVAKANTYTRIQMI
jgi:hypothetical protein